ncbi:MAG TPA: PDZ domain-containing protein [Anaerolineae bacterium]|nr:PDZ domain-containing protein [Anaerolineae bacterium]
MNKKLIWFGPISVLAFVVLLALMYGWVDNMDPIGIEGVERPETKLARLQGGQAQLINNPTFPSGIGNGQIQLINNPTFPSGIGNGQIQLINQNQPAGPYLGMKLVSVPGAVAKDLNIQPNTGAYVDAVVSLSPAQKAGINIGDVLLKCDHKQVTGPEQVGQILINRKAGDVIKLVVNRNRRKKSFHVKLENAPMGLDVGAIKKPVWMGADIQDIDAVMKIQFNLPDKKGVIVSHVAPGSPAANSDLKTGDVIRRFGATRIRDVAQLQSLILKGQPGQQVQLNIFRNGQYQTVPIVLGQRSPEINKVAFIGPADMVIEGSWIGMDVTELSVNDAADLGMPTGTRGVLVNDVESPPATMVGFQTGDVISAVNGMPTPDMKGFVEATRNQSSAVVDVIRGNVHLFISVPPPGFTQQGTRLNTGVNNKMKQVAFTGPVQGNLAILTTGPELNFSVAGDIGTQPYVILVDQARNSYAIINPNNLNPISELIGQYNITALICSDISGNTASDLAAKGVAVYTGVVGTADDAIRLYVSHSLVAMHR